MVSCGLAVPSWLSDLTERTIRPKLLPAPRRRGDRAHRAKLIVMQIADIRTVSQPQIGVRIGQNLLRRPTKITDLDWAEGGDEPTILGLAQQPRAVSPVGAPSSFAPWPRLFESQANHLFAIVDIFKSLGNNNKWLLHTMKANPKNGQRLSWRGFQK
jgi:hypothetical protein